MDHKPGIHLSLESWCCTQDFYFHGRQLAQRIGEDIPYKMEVVHANSSDSSIGNGQPKVRVLPKALVVKVAKDAEAVKPNIVDEAAFGLENARECLLFIAALFTEFKEPAKCIAQAIGLLTMLRHHFENQVPLTDVHWGPYYQYNGAAAQANMQEKISTLPGMDVKRVVEIKLAELRAATPWLKDLGYGTDGIPGIAFTGAWVCLSDTVAHFEHRLRHM